MKIVNRIKDSDDFALTIKKGQARNSKSFTLHFMKNELSYTRVGISVSTKVGHAVVRNRIKRQVRAMCDNLIKYDAQGIDLVIVVRKPFLDFDYNNNQSLLSDLLYTQVGIIK